MGERIELTEQDLIEAILQAQAQGASGPAAGALTLRELQTQTGWGYDRVRMRMRQVHMEGRLESIRVMTTTIDGRMSTVPAYRLRTPADEGQ